MGAWHWLDQQQIMKVTITSPMDDQSEIYQVKKKDIQENQIITIAGVKVRFSNQERITIAPNE